MCHRACVGVPVGLQVPSSWLCPDCRAKLPRSNADSTPARGACRMHTMDQSVSEEYLNTTAMDTTLEIQEACFDMRIFREEMRQASEECKAWKSEMAEVRLLMVSMGERMSKLEERVDVIERQVATACVNEETLTTIRSLETAVSQLKTDLNDREQDLLLNDVDVAGIPEEDGESVQHLVLSCAAKLGVQLDERDLVNCARIGGGRQETQGMPLRPRVITLRLARRSIRDQLIKAARVRRSLTTEGLGLRSPPQPMYVNERLTRLNRQLFNQARELTRKAGWRFVWTREGRIYVRREHGSLACRIRNDGDLERVFGRVAVSG